MPVTAKTPRMGSHRGFEGGSTPKIEFLLMISNIEPTCRTKRENDHPIGIQLSLIRHSALLANSFQSELAD